MAGMEELREDTVQQLDLPRGSDDGVVDLPGRVHFVFNAVKQEGVLADLSELHQLVTQSLDTTSSFAIMVVC